MKTRIILLILVTTLSASCGPVRRLLEKGGTKYTIEVRPTGAGGEAITDEALTILASRLDAAGIGNRIAKIAPDRIEVLAYGKNDPERTRALLVASSRFELAKVISGSAPFQTYRTKEEALQAGEHTPGTMASRVLPYSEREDGHDRNVFWIVVENPPVLDGRVIRDARAIERSPGTYSIAFSLNKEGAEKFGEWTGKNIGSYIAVILNDEVKSAPVIKGRIFDTGQIDGRFTKASAEDMAMILKSGYLPATLTLIGENTFEK